MRKNKKIKENKKRFKEEIFKINNANRQSFFEEIVFLILLIIVMIITAIIIVAGFGNI